MRFQDEDGFTLVEMLIAIFLFAVLSIGFYQVMLSAVRGSNDTQDIAQVAQEARLGFNRMIRDTRETTKLVTATDTEYKIWVDYNGNETVNDSELEYLSYSYDEAESRIVLTALTGPGGGDPDLLTGSEGPLAGTSPATLVSNVDDTGSHEVFAYASNFLQYDTDGNGEVDAEEIDNSGVGVDNDVLEGLELQYVSDVNYAFDVEVGGASRTFFGQAQIRNRRYSNL